MSCHLTDYSVIVCTSSIWVKSLKKCNILTLTWSLYVWLSYCPGPGAAIFVSCRLVWVSLLVIEEKGAYPSINKTQKALKILTDTVLTNTRPLLVWCSVKLKREYGIKLHTDVIIYLYWMRVEKCLNIHSRVPIIFGIFSGVNWKTTVPVVSQHDCTLNYKEILF